MRNFVICFFLLLSLMAKAQIDSMVVQLDDTRYVEDQFYVGLGYNFLLNAPSGIQQNNLSYSLQGGFIKDIPLNSRRNWAIGIGAGFGVNALYSNLYALKDDAGDIVYNKIPDGLEYRRNNLVTWTAEFPVEVRWRTSDKVTYRFWRLYSGLKFSYVLDGASRFVGETTTVKFGNDDLEPWRYGIYSSFGYNTWNFYAYYQLNSLFTDGTENALGQPLDMQTLTLGLMFYIL